jgi:NAD(P)-dependent dehydrogenase (short-subunit alcohol dehydrogenase family)
MQNIILFGGKGYLGQELSRQLIIDEHNVFVVDKTEGDFIGDVTNGEFIEYIFRILDRKRLNNLSIVYLIGNSIFTKFENRTEQEIDYVLKSNINTFSKVVQEYTKFCLEKKINGNVVAISSIYGKYIPDFNIYSTLDRLSTEIYGASKAGLDYLIRYFAKSFGTKKIRFNAVAPGGIYQDSVHNQDFQDLYAKRVAENRMVEVNEVAKVIVFLLSKNSSGINGQIIRVDAGFGL